MKAPGRGHSGFAVTSCIKVVDTFRGGATIAARVSLVRHISVYSVVESPDGITLCLCRVSISDLMVPVSVLESLIASLKDVCSGTRDRRKGPVRYDQYAMAYSGLAAFSVLFMRSPSFLAHQKALADGHGRSNCQTLFGMTAIPTNAYIRLMLDGAPPSAFDPERVNYFDTSG